MKFKTVLVGSVALGCGLVAMLGVQQRLSGQQAEPDMVAVYVAAAEIPAGRVIDATLIKKQPLPKSLVPPGAVTDASEIVDRALSVKAFAGEIILQAKLVDRGRAGVSVQIPKGFKTYALPVSLSQIIGGLLLPGDHVDVLVTYKYRDPATGQELQKTKMFLSNITVFAVDTLTDSETETKTGEKQKEKSKSTGAKIVSFLVNDEQLHVLAHASQRGTLHLALRNPDDKSEPKIESLDDLLFDTQPSSHGAVAEEGGENPPPQGDLNKFLDNLPQDEPAAAATAAPSAPPAKPVRTWTITIIEKGVKTTETFEIPDDLPASGTAAALAPEPSAQPTAAVDPSSTSPTPAP